MSAVPALRLAVPADTRDTLRQADRYYRRALARDKANDAIQQNFNDFLRVRAPPRPQLHR